MNTYPAGDELGRPIDEELDDVDAEVVEDLDADEEAEHVVGGFSSQCMSG